MKELIVVNDRFNMVVAPTEVIWNWQQYEVTSLLYFHFPLSSYLSASNPVAGCWNQSDIEQDVIWTKCYCWVYEPIKVTNWAMWLQHPINICQEVTWQIGKKACLEEQISDRDEP